MLPWVLMMWPGLLLSGEGCPSLCPSFSSSSLVLPLVALSLYGLDHTHVSPVVQKVQTK